MPEKDCFRESVPKSQRVSERECVRESVYQRESLDGYQIGSVCVDVRDRERKSVCLCQCQRKSVCVSV